MSGALSLLDIAFTENSQVDVNQLNALYRSIGWDSHGRRTEAETTEMLSVSRYRIAAHTGEGCLVGFARVSGDPYVVQVSRYVSVTLTDGSGVEGFYQRFGFRVVKDVALMAADLPVPGRA